MIEKLTPEQEAQLEVYRDKWISIGLATGPSDRQATEKGVVEAYKAAGFAPPRGIVWAKGPTEGAELAGLAELSTGGYDDFVARRARGEKAKPSTSSRLWAQFDAGWCSYYDYFEQVCGLDCVKPLHGLMDVARGASWWWAYDGLAILVEHPLTIVRDEQGRLHNPKGPSVSFADGFELYSWRGTTVPKEWITSKPKAGDVLTHTNVEVRRAGCEILGWEVILRDLGAKVLDRHPDPQIGELLSVNLPDAPDSRFLRVKCGTGRTFCLPVPNTCKTAGAANAWTYGVETSDEIHQFLAYKVRT